MNHIITYLLWGAVQGLTEFFPVSSSAHLVFLSQMLPFDGGNNLLFFTSLHFGTLIALLFFFRKRIISIVSSLSTPSQRSLLVNIAIATLVSGAVAFVLKDLSELLSQQARYTAGILASMGLFLLVSRFLPEGQKDEREFHWGIAILFGLVQGIAVFPGISRSGTTILLLLALGFRRDVGFELSFLTGIPIVFLAFAYELLRYGGAFSPWYFVGMISSFIFGVVALRFLRFMVIKGQLYWFGIYCLVASSLACVLFPR